MDKTKVKYRLDKSGDFIIENYSYAKAFSSFFPGIAGLRGVPLWAFYVNRGQAIASFGTKDKSGAILEFYPANQAYYLAPLKGFRTFIKLKKGAEQILYEPFRKNGCPYSASASSSMRINPYKLQIEETNLALNLTTNVTYMTIPEEPFAGLLRSLTLINNSKKPMPLDVIDGLAQIIPYAVNEWHQKHMSRTIEAWVRISNLSKKIPFYKLKVQPDDKPELEYVDRGNFYLAYQLKGRSARQLNVIIDPSIVFGRDADIGYAQNFARGDFSLPKTQRAEGKTPSAFAHSRVTVAPGEAIQIISLIGNIDTEKHINSLTKKIVSHNFLAKKLETNKDIIANLQNSIFTKSSSREFDSYAKQTFLDNFLRGGFPYSIATDKDPFVFYLYARKHGDLERDYNAFSLLPSYFSQGNGAYRDINQNRRNDVLINPNVAEDNIHTFINAIQPDGFNPLLIDGLMLYIISNKACQELLNKYFTKKSQRRAVDEFLKGGFTPGGLLGFLEKEASKPNSGTTSFLRSLLTISSKEDLIRPGEGFWVDHWTYNLDLLESYLSVYPDRLKSLLIDKKDFTFYDTDHKVLPRDEKYVYVNGKVRQFGAVEQDKKKNIKLLSLRKTDATKVHTLHGKGKVYKTTLLVKLLTLIINKGASFDPSGIGIEMEANKPGWCDSLNNMPGIFGSSVSETAELKRLILFVQSALDKLELPDNCKASMPDESYEFAHALKKTLAETNAFKYWDKAATLKEEYRKKVWLGFSGKNKDLNIVELKEILTLLLKRTNKALKKSLQGTSALPRTYFIHEAKRYRFIKQRGKNKLNRNGLPVVRVLEFKNRPISYFLEAPVHLMKVLKGLKERRSLYNAVKSSQLYDKKLKMYKINAPLKGMPFEIGRSMVFTPGWLENESVWLHMEYKYLLELIRGGLHKEFFQDLDKALVAFMDPNLYGRSILENSSFIVSSAHPEKSLHGNGFVARLTGATCEFVSIWLNMVVGKKPFSLDKGGKLTLKFSPVLPGRLFTKEASKDEFYFAENKKEEILIPKNSFAFSFLGKTLVVYHNPRRANTYGQGAVGAKKIILSPKKGKEVKIKAGVLSSYYARLVREGKIKQIDVFLG